jgi:hypothetical protein
MNLWSINVNISARNIIRQRFEHTPALGLFDRNKIARFVLILCFGALLSSCSTPTPSQDLNDYLTNQISDASRSQALLALSEELNHQIADMATDLREFDLRLRTYNMDYDAEPSGFVALFDEARENRLQHRAQILETFLDMRAITKPDEWRRAARLQIKLATYKTRAASPL